MSKLEDLIPGVSQAKLIAGIVMGAAVIGFVWWIIWMVGELGDRKEKITALETNVETLTKNTDILRQNYLTCQSANSTNADTIAALQQERDDAEAAVKALAEQKAKDDWYIDQLEDRIGIQRRDPTQNGPLAPVLRDTIKEIQERNRDE